MSGKRKSMAKTAPLPAEKLVRAKDIADTFQISIPTVAKWRLSGKIRGYKVGKLVFYDLDEVREDIRKLGTAS